MIWLRDCGLAAPCLPAVWIVDSSLRPANLFERGRARHSVARQVVAAQTRKPLSAVTIGHDDRGKPTLPQERDLAISYATRNGMVIVALARSAVGADVELIEPQADIPWNVLHPLEREDLHRQALFPLSEAFYRLWTAKEAWLKASGTGLLTEPSSFAIRFESESAWHATDGRFRIETRLARRQDELFAAAVAFHP
jgi:phosphopantetheinyl transferase